MGFSFPIQNKTQGGTSAAWEGLDWKMADSLCQCQGKAGGQLRSRNHLWLLKRGKLNQQHEGAMFQCWQRLVNKQHRIKKENWRKEDPSQTLVAHLLETSCPHNHVSQLPFCFDWRRQGAREGGAHDWILSGELNLEHNFLTKRPCKSGQAGLGAQDSLWESTHPWQLSLGGPCAKGEGSTEETSSPFPSLIAFFSSVFSFSTTK